MVVAVVIISVLVVVITVVVVVIAVVVWLLDGRTVGKVVIFGTEIANHITQTTSFATGSIALVIIVLTNT